MPGHQEVDVVDVAGVDRAAEDEAEQQHEHHRLDEGEDHVHRLAQGLAQLPGGHHAAVGEHLAERQPRRFGRDHAAFFPVSVRNTSSRLGCCSSIAAIGSPLESSRRTASADGAGVGDREADLARGGVDDRLVGEIGEHCAASADWVGSTRTESTSAPTVALSSVAVPSAAILPWSTTAIRCASRSASSRYCVVSRTVVPSRRSWSTVFHSSWRVRGIEAGGRLVEQHHGRAAGEARAEVEPAPHPAAVGGHAAIGGLGQPEALEHVGGARLGLAHGQPVEPPDHLEVLAPGELLVDGGELAREPDPPAHRQRLGDDVVAEDPRAARRSAPAASRAPSRASSCRRRWGRAGRTRSRPRRSGRARRARRRPRRSGARPRRGWRAVTGALLRLEGS